MDRCEARDLHPKELEAAVGVLSRGMRDNPLHTMAYGPIPESRRERHAILMRGLLTVLNQLRLICVVRDGRVVGVAAMAPPGTCQPSPVQRLRLLATLARLGPTAASRVLCWTSAWARRDPHDPHLHVGPVAVDAGVQGHGIGTLLMTEVCRHADLAHQASYLETDKLQNVAFYRRFGFVVLGEQRVLDVPTWYMRRPGR